MVTGEDCRRGNSPNLIRPAVIYRLFPSLQPEVPDEETITRRPKIRFKLFYEIPNRKERYLKLMLRPFNCLQINPLLHHLP